MFFSSFFVVITMDILSYHTILGFFTISFFTMRLYTTRNYLIKEKYISTLAVKEVCFSMKGWWRILLFCPTFWCNSVCQMGLWMKYSWKNTALILLRWGTLSRKNGKERKEKKYMKNREGGNQWRICKLFWTFGFKWKKKVAHHFYSREHRTFSTGFSTTEHATLLWPIRLIISNVIILFIVFVDFFIVNFLMMQLPE